MSILAFGEFEADLELFELRRYGAVVEISPRNFDILLYLIRFRDRVVSKSELRENVWQAQALSPSAIPTAVLALRKALGDEADSARHIATVRGRGYRFVAELKEMAQQESEAAARPDQKEVPRGSRAAFVGREPELAAIAAAFGRSMAGAPQVVLLSGEAGIGKTRTAEEFAARARGGGAIVLVGRCREGEGAPAFWPWVQVVRSVFELAEPAALENDFRRLAPVLAQMLPEVGDRFPGLESAPSLEAEAARFRLFDTVTMLLRKVGSKQPVVVLLDDLHRADPASLQLLRFVARELRDARVLLLATYRDVETQRDPPKLSIITELVRQEPSRSVQLHGLSTTEVAEFVACSVLSGLAPGSLARTLHEQSGGNPFFLTQLVHLLEAEGSVEGIGEGKRAQTLLPGGVREAIARQLDGLPEETRRALRVAAIAGREFPATGVAEVLGIPVPRLLGVLEPALDARMVFGIPERLGQFRFAHVLLRDTIYERLTALERVSLHQSIAETLERHYADDLGPHAAELAYHFREAVHAGGSETAVRYAVRAGEWATARLAYEDAAHHLRSALQILEQAGPGNLVQRCELLLALGEAEMHAGERDHARRSLYDAAASAKLAGNPELLARAALRLAPGFFTIEIGVLDSLLVDLLEDAIAALGGGDSALRAQLLARLAMAHAWSGAEEHQSRLTIEAINVAERVGDPGAQAYALSAKHGLLWGPERLHARIALVERMGELAASSGDTDLILMHLLFRITVGLELGRIDAVDRDIATYTRIAESLNQPQSLWYSRSFRAMRLMMRGCFADAARLSEELLAVGGRAKDVNAINTFGLHVCIQRWEQGRVAEIISYIDEFRNRYPAIAGWRFSRAAMCFEAGRVQEARHEFERIAQDEFVSIPRNEQWSIAACLTADLCCWLADARRAETLYSMLLPAIEHRCVIGFGAAYFGSIARRLGNLAVTRQSWSEAELHLTTALEMEEQIGATPWIAHVLHDQARMLIKRGGRGNRDQAKLLVARARETASTLGLVSLSKKLEFLN